MDLLLHKIRSRRKKHRDFMKSVWGVVENINRTMFSSPHSKIMLKTLTKQSNKPSYLREDVLSPENSPWRKLKAAGNDRAYMKFVRVPVKAVEWLSDAVKTECERQLAHPFPALAGNSFGRTPWYTDFHDLVALSLRFYGSTQSLGDLGLEFGLLASDVSKYTNKMQQILLHVLRKERVSRIEMPSEEEMKIAKEIVAAEFPMLDGCYGFTDGVRTPLNRHPDAEVQEEFYNYKEKGHCLGHVLVHIASGQIVIASVNQPGARHDSYIAEVAGAYDVLEQEYNESKSFIVVDQAFPIKYGSMLRIPKANEDNTKWMNAKGDELRAQITRLRTRVEWNMGSIQKAFPRFAKKQRAKDSVWRSEFYEVVCRLFNLRCRMGASIQSLTVARNSRAMLCDWTVFGAPDPLCLNDNQPILDYDWGL